MNTKCWRDRGGFAWFEPNSSIRDDDHVDIASFQIAYVFLSYRDINVFHDAA